ncbi:prepilin-type N-terminal cleavage/methylation domain-containing protein [Oxalobacteraceae bacterium R-40]|uniref:Type II secretion system protein H n=1 Tax=Keguizhuia sedimenti TaxID=3064264 RepID=A0ABU1BRS7_9BURK|nr:prepilin-type N-terminal cleavage/methylation domain-containing protein [Oxalobacteraceae bacterium R-40]
MLASGVERGLTLVELLIGMAIVSAVLALGVPSFSRMIQNAQVRSAGESIVNGLHTARNEALRRNASIRFNLTDTTGRVAWTVTCVVTTTDCPATAIQSYSSNEGGSNARIGISKATTIPSSAYATAIASGTGLSSGAGVTFNNLGSVPPANAGSDITRIDITNAADADARRLVIVLGTGGSVRMCDPLHDLSTNPQGCTSP